MSVNIIVPMLYKAKNIGEMIKILTENGCNLIYDRESGKKCNFCVEYVMVWECADGYIVLLKRHIPPGECANLGMTREECEKPSIIVADEEMLSMFI